MNRERGDRGDRRRGDRPERPRDRGSPENTPPPPRQEKANRTGLNEYWIDGAGINREVLQRQICRMLGNEAKCKPDKYNVGLRLHMHRTKH